MDAVIANKAKNQCCFTGDNRLQNDILLSTLRWPFRFYTGLSPPPVIGTPPTPSLSSANSPPVAIGTPLSPSPSITSPAGNQVVAYLLAAVLCETGKWDLGNKQVLEKWRLSKLPVNTSSNLHPCIAESQHFVLKSFKISYWNALVP